MEDFRHLFASHFRDNDRSLTNTLAGFVDHAVRLRASLPTKEPLASQLLAACLDAEALSQRVQLVQQQLGLGLGDQKQAGTATDAALTTALARVRKNEGTLKGDALVEDEAERQRIYALLYPSGLSYYTRAGLGTELADRLSEYLLRTEQESAILGDKFVGRVQAELGPFRKTRETQVAALGKTNGLRTDRHDLVDDINEQCDYDYHLLSAYYRRELGRVANYWNPVYYLRAAPRTAVGGVKNLVIQPHQHRQLYDLAAYPQLTQLTLTLRDGGPVQLARVDKATSPLPATALTVPPGPPLAVALAAVPGTGPHLVAYNETDKALHLDGQLSS